MFGEVRISIPKRELELQFKTLETQQKFHTETMKSIIEIMEKCGLEATAQALVALRSNHLEVIRDQLDGLSKYLG